MSQSIVWWRALVLSTIALCIVFAMSASGQNKTTSSFGTVDMQRISTQYKAKSEIETQLNAMQDKFQKQLDRRDSMPFLTEEDQKQLDDLYGKPTPTDADKKSISDIEGKAKTMNAEFQDLSQRTQDKLTDADKKKLEGYTTQMASARQAYNTLKDSAATQVRNFSQSKADQLMTDIRAAVAKVAEKKGVAIVFDNQVALYAGNDLTDDTVALLNKK